MRQRLLQQGGRIAIVSPSGAISADYMRGGIEGLRSMGYEVELMPHAEGCATSVFAATDDERAADLAEALRRDDIDVVWCARGGYGAMRTLMALERYGGWRRVFSETDKMVVGFSDITALHAAAASVGNVGILGPMLKHIAVHGISAEDVRLTLQSLTTGNIEVECVPHKGSTVGKAQGKVIGGNLSILYSLMATPVEPDAEGAILFIEDLSEYRYHIDRMMRSLKFSGFLKRLSGVIVGQMTGMRDGATPFGRDAYQIVADAVAEYGYPVLMGYPSGHAEQENYPLVIGAMAEMEVSAGRGVLRMTMNG